MIEFHGSRQRRCAAQQSPRGGGQHPGHYRRDDAPERPMRRQLGENQKFRYQTQDQGNEERNPTAEKQPVEEQLPLEARAGSSDLGENLVHRC
jgi:hypothetical protein